MLFGMLPGGIVLVLGSFQVMTERNPGVVRGLFVIARFVMLGGLTMMFGGVLVVLRRMFVMLVDLVLCHFVSRWTLSLTEPLANARRPKARYAVHNNVPGFNKPALNSGRPLACGLGRSPGSIGQASEG